MKLSVDGMQHGQLLLVEILCSWLRIIEVEVSPSDHSKFKFGILDGGLQLCWEFETSGVIKITNAVIIMYIKEC